VQPATANKKAVAALLLLWEKAGVRRWLRKSS
jgi:hypothetical protein